MHNYYFTYNNIREFYSIKKVADKNVGIKLGYKDAISLLTNLISQDLVDVIDANNKIELVFQNSRVIVDNINVFRAQDSLYDKYMDILLTRIKECLERANIKEYKNRLPKGYVPQVNRRKHKGHKLIGLGVAAALCAVVLLSGSASDNLSLLNFEKKDDDLDSSMSQDVGEDEKLDDNISSGKLIGAMDGIDSIIEFQDNVLQTEVLPEPTATPEPTPTPTPEPTPSPTAVVDTYMGSSTYDDELSILLDIYNVDYYQFSVVCRTILHEGGQLNYSEAYAITTVVVNRLLHNGYPNNIYSIITQENQFASFFNEHYLRIENFENYEGYQGIIRCLKDFAEDQTNRAHNYVEFRGNGNTYFADHGIKCEYFNTRGNVFGIQLPENRIAYIEFDSDLRDALVNGRTNS